MALDSRARIGLVAVLASLGCAGPMACDDDGKADGGDTLVADASADATATDGDVGTGGDVVTTAPTDASTAPTDASGDTLAGDATETGATTPDTATDLDAGDAPDATVDALPATEYCERSAAIFCDYYLRCDRMAVPDVDTCLQAFAEGCENGFEPIYAGHAERGELVLSSAGLSQCDAHLETVACDQQLFDLDGPCSDVWQGQVGTGGTCGPGIGSFVCDDANTCVLDLQTFCGTCEPAADVGESCEPGVLRCHVDARCVETAPDSFECVARALPGESCGDTSPCVTGAACVNGTCAGFETVAVGERCDQARRCQYRAECVSGTCVAAVGQGESCATAPCQTGGWCDPASETCVALGRAGATCTEPSACVSLTCAGGTCGEAPAGCFASPP